MKFAYFVSLCAVLLLVGCDRPTYEEKQQTFNETWGPEVTFKGEHLLVNWGDIEGVNPPGGALSLKIPRAYLDSRFGEQDEKGKVERLYLEMMLPDGDPLPPVKKSNMSTEEEWERIKELNEKRIFVALPRDYYMKKMEDIHRQKFQVGGAGKNIFLDGEVDGLEKYSAMICLADHKTSPPDYLAMVQRGLSAKTVDDPSPAGCYRNTRQFILVTPEVEEHDDLLLAKCRDQTCYVYFNAANRTANLTINRSDLDRLQEKVGLARRVISGFVLYRNP